MRCAACVCDCSRAQHILLRGRSAVIMTASPLCLTTLMLALVAVAQSNTVAIDSASAESHPMENKPIDACPDLESWDTLEATGFLVLRNATPPEELEHMLADQWAIPNPDRHLCGASYVRPTNCHRSISLLSERYPGTKAILEQTFDRLTAQHERNLFGSEYTLANGEYVKINKWPFRQNISCVFRAIFDVVAVNIPTETDNGCECPSTEEVRADADSESGELSTHRCWLWCMYEAVKATPPEQLLEAMAPFELVSNSGSEGNSSMNQATGFVANAEDGTCSRPNPYAFLNGPVQYVLGSDGVWSSIRSHITKETSVPVTNGYHDWHIDGPATGAGNEEVGRYNKVFIMVYKDAAHDLHRTNVRLAPNSAKRGFDQRGNPIWAPVRKPIPTWFDEQRGGGPSSGFKPLRTWYLRDDWDDIEHNACDIPLVPGDILITRQDVWHRTQDIFQDRMLLKVDVFRPPIPEDQERAHSADMRMLL